MISYVPRAAFPAAFFSAILAASLPIAGAEGLILAEARPRAQAEAALHGYWDDNRLAVYSAGLGLNLPLGRAWALRLRCVADHIAIEAAPASAAADPHHVHGGHGHIEEDENPAVDAISGASARVGKGSTGSSEARLEGAAGLSRRMRLGSNPVTVTGEGRFSGEPDYLSLGGTLAAMAELLGGNTVIAAFIGGGRDEIDPEVIPAGQQGQWPASQVKLSGGMSVSQSLTPRLAISAGASAALQGGRLSSPYRNSRVGVTYFPERLPGNRLRGTAFAQVSYYLGWGAALHVREGAYADDWDVLAWIPETALAKEFGLLLLTARHRFYAQTRASFYRSSYPGRDGYQTGDARLGRLYGQTGALEAEAPLIPKAGRLGPVASVEYAFSRLEYPDLFPRVLYGHVVTLRVTGGF